MTRLRLKEVLKQLAQDHTARQYQIMTQLLCHKPLVFKTLFYCFSNRESVVISPCLRGEKVNEALGSINRM